MASTPDERRTPPRFGLALAIIVGLLLLYVLSVGPSQVLFNRGYRTGPITQSIPRYFGFATRTTSSMTRLFST